MYMTGKTVFHEYFSSHTSYKICKISREEKSNKKGEKKLFVVKICKVRWMIEGNDDKTKTSQKMVNL